MRVEEERERIMIIFVVYIKSIVYFMSFREEGDVYKGEGVMVLIW